MRPYYQASFQCPDSGVWCVAEWYPDSDDPTGPGRLELHADDEYATDAQYAEAEAWCRARAGDGKRFETVDAAEEWLRTVAKDEDLELW